MAKLSNTIQTFRHSSDNSTTQQLNNSSTISSTTPNSGTRTHHKLNYYGISWNPGNPEIRNPKSENGETVNDMKTEFGSQLCN